MVLLKLMATYKKRKKKEIRLLFYTYIVIVLKWVKDLAVSSEIHKIPLEENRYKDVHTQIQQDLPDIFSRGKPKQK